MGLGQTLNPMTGVLIGRGTDTEDYKTHGQRACKRLGRCWNGAGNRGMSAKDAGASRKRQEECLSKAFKASKPC